MGRGSPWRPLNHAPTEWAEPKVRKKDYVRPALPRMEWAGHGAYFILKSMEQGQTLRSTVPALPATIPTTALWLASGAASHYYYYIRDETLGPMVMRVASFFPFQTRYYLNCHNFIEKELVRENVGLSNDTAGFVHSSEWGVVL